MSKFLLRAYLLILLFSVAYYIFPRPRVIGKNENAQNSELDYPDLRIKRFEHALKQWQTAGDSPDVRAELERLALTKPDYVPAHKFWVQQMTESGDYRQSTAMYVKLLHHLSIIKQSGTLEESADASEVLARVYSEFDEDVLAIEELRRLVGIRPAYNLPLAEALKQVGEQNESRTAQTKAIAHFENAIKTDQPQPELLLQHAKALQLFGNYSDAADLLRQHVAEHPELLDSLMDYSLRAIDTAVENDNFSLALERMQQAINDDPDCGELWQRISRHSLSEHQSAPNAKKLFDSVSQQDAGYKIAKLALGTELISNRKYAAAVMELDQAHRIDPDDPTIRHALAVALYKTKDQFHCTRALPLVDDLIERFPENMSLRESRGQIYANLGRVDDAISELELAERALRNYPPLVMTLAELYEKRGETAKAVALRDRSGTTFDDDPDGDQRAADLLRELLRDP